MTIRLTLWLGAMACAALLLVALWLLATLLHDPFVSTAIVLVDRPAEFGP